MREVDWFNLIFPGEMFAGIDRVSEEYIAAMLRADLKQKRYIKPGRVYLIATDYGQAILMDSDGNQATGFLR